MLGYFLLDDLFIVYSDINACKIDYDLECISFCPGRDVQWVVKVNLDVNRQFNDLDNVPGEVDVSARAVFFISVSLS